MPSGHFLIQTDGIKILNKDRENTYGKDKN